MNSFSLKFHNDSQLKEQLDVVDKSYTRPLIQLFSDQPTEMVEQYYQQIKARWPESVVIGSSAGHTIHQGAIVKGATSLVVTQFEQAELVSAATTVTDSYAMTSQSLRDALNIQSDTKMIVCFGDRIGAHDSELFSAFSGDRIPVVGGATVVTDQGRWAMLEGEFYQSTLVAVAINAPNLSVWQKSYNAWNPVGQTFVVTKAQGNRVLELNDQPIGQIYRRYLADGNDFSDEMLHGFPLLKGEQQAQDIYSPRTLHDDKSIEFDRALAVGDQVRFCYDHPELTIQQVQQGAYNLAKHQPDNVFIYNCTSRLDFIEGNEELTPLQSVANCYGFYCMGELYKDDTQQSMLHHSMTLIAMREGEPSQEVKYPKLDLTSPISPLFSMIRNSFVDLESYNQSMQSQIDSQAKALVSSYLTDSRTGLPNRTVLLEDISSMDLDDCLLDIKINNLTDINEKYGYSIGDNVLLLLTQFLQQKIEEHITQGVKLYAIGVGEWAILFTRTLSNEELYKEIETIIEQVESLDFKNLSFLESAHLAISVTVGIAEKKEFLVCSSEAFLFKAIEARRQAMKSNRHFCNASDLIHREQQRRERLEKLSIANHAIQHKNVLPYVQPIFDARTKALASYECLGRLTHNQQVLSPGYFLPLIQETRLYTKFSQTMISNSFDLMANRQENFTLNLSHQDMLDDNTLALLEKQVGQLQVPQRVGFEIVESEQIDDFSQMIEVCNHFRRLGVKIIVDDFGSGYSNLDEIIQLKPDIIKLDGSLIRHIDSDVKQRKITAQMVQLCKALDAEVVAEFIHSQQVCDVAVDMGVDYLQGFYLGEPVELK